MNILCIGNSFSVDASTYVHQIAKAAGLDINIYVLYIGGCPIERHWNNFLSKEKAYEFYINGNKTPEMYCDIFEGLRYTKYDFITFQQVSGKSGDVNTFFPELNKLMEGVRKYTDGQFLLHKTWSYAKYYVHEKYGNNPLDQSAMDDDIKKAYIEASARSGIEYIIPSGEAIKLARKKYGDELNRDGFHLNERGRTLLGMLYVYYLTGKFNLDFSNFKPSGYTYDDITPPVNEKELDELRVIAKQAIINNKGYNLYD